MQSAPRVRWNAQNVGMPVVCATPGGPEPVTVSCAPVEAVAAHEDAVDLLLVDLLEHARRRQTRLEAAAALAAVSESRCKRGFAAEAVVNLTTPVGQLPTCWPPHTRT